MWCDKAPSQRLILAPTGPLHRDFDDVRRFYDAARSAAAAAVDAGAKKPLLWVPTSTQAQSLTADFAHAVEAVWFGFAQGIWQPLEAREHFGDEVEGIQQVGLIRTSAMSAKKPAPNGCKPLKRAVALRVTYVVPSQSAWRPLRFAEYCQKAFANSPVKVTVIDDKPQLEHEYPLLAAVGRASFGTHQRPCVIRLEYTPGRCC